MLFQPFLFSLNSNKPVLRIPSGRHSKYTTLFSHPILIIDSKYIIDNLDFSKKLEIFLKAKKDEYSTWLNHELRLLQALEADSTVLKDEQKRHEMHQNRRSLNEKRDSLTKKLELLLTNVSNYIHSRFRQFLSEKYLHTIVLDRNKGTVLYYPLHLDATQKILTQLNPIISQKQPADFLE